MLTHSDMFKDLIFTPVVEMLEDTYYNIHYIKMSYAVCFFFIPLNQQLASTYLFAGPANSLSLLELSLSTSQIISFTFV